MAALLAGLLCVVGVALGSPVRTYDQRQQGELNIHAQLDNIVILLIPATNLNLMSLAGKTKYSGEKPAGIDKTDFLQLFQKTHKNDIDRYETVNDSPGESLNDVAVPIITSQSVILHHDEKNGEKEEEVVATVQEMKPETTEKATDPPKSEATEDSPIKEHSTISETVQESVLTVSIPEELKDKVKKTEETSKESTPVKTAESVSTKEPEKVLVQEEPKGSTVKSSEVFPEKEVIFPHIKEEPSDMDRTNVSSSELSAKTGPTIEDLIRPVAAKEEKPLPSSSQKTITEESTSSGEKKPEKPADPVRLMEGIRKEKVIRYKPESKWAPELVDLLGPPKPKPRELDERQRFANLCSPGVWDTELKTCIMPGETRSRNELARFLEAMRFGIAIPSQ